VFCYELRFSGLLRSEKWQSFNDASGQSIGSHLQG